MDIADRLKNFFNNNNSSAAGQTANPTEAGGPVNDPLEDVIRRFEQMDFRIDEIHEKFKDLPDIDFDFGVRESKTDFKDDTFSEALAYELKHVSDDELATLGRKYIPMIYSGFSEKGTAAIFLLAYNLKYYDGRRLIHLFPYADPLRKADDLSLDQLEDSITNTGTVSLSGTDTPRSSEYSCFVATPTVGKVEWEAAGYSFVAASMLRLFAKPPENYVKAFTHIVNGFKNFYSCQFPLQMTPPKLDALRGFAFRIGANQRCKMSLYRILYASGGTTKASGLRGFLYDIHLANTGMHIVGIFFRLCKALNCQPPDLLTVLNTRASTRRDKREVSALTSMLELEKSGDASHQRKMWRFGRLFDEKFMMPLQTKRCQDLTYTLASALKSEDFENNKDILNIVQFQNMSDSRRGTLDVIALEVVKKVRRFQTGN